MNSCGWKDFALHRRHPFPRKFPRGRKLKTPGTLSCLESLLRLEKLQLSQKRFFRRNNTVENRVSRVDYDLKKKFSNTLLHYDTSNLFYCYDF